ncbi:hypothetical protein SmJEL517_g04794 [Synchytrium microbalum]|uniref:Histidine kinase n=1 Tax=Synchytrium microbalum TaxID=1806994 RepID=A0A507BXY7_9FUNG|nr:uncharacterized protein SmJEL517_g04794 [Synchytrium microbalum]TPX31971.1 hypothetical protein SmJEL517_g04794 [Synchytrium microbalum]
MVSGGIEILANCSILLVWLSSTSQLDQSAISIYAFPPGKPISVPATVVTNNYAQILYSAVYQADPSIQEYVLGYNVGGQHQLFPDTGVLTLTSPCSSDNSSTSQPIGTETILAAASDILITIAYFSIPIELLYFLIRANEFPYPQITSLFILFIFCCGMTHLSAAWMPWHPSIHWVSTALKILTAVVSCFTAVALFFAIPHAVAYPKYVKSVETQIVQRLRAERILLGEFNHMKLFRDIVHNIRYHFLVHTPQKKQEILNTAVKEIATKVEGAKRCMIFQPNHDNVLECIAEHLAESSNDVDSEETDLQTMDEDTRLIIPPTTVAPVLLGTLAPPEIKDVQPSFDRLLKPVTICGRSKTPLSTYFGLSTREKALIVPTNLGDEQNGLLVLVCKDTIDELETEEEFGTATLLLDLAEQVSIARAQANLILKDRFLIAQLEEQNQALTEARKEVKFAQAAKDFTAVMSHEMRTPLFAISSLLAMISEMEALHTPAAKEVLDMMDLARGSAQMLVTIVNNILDFAKYEDEQFHLDRSPFVLREALEMAADVVAVQDGDAKFPQIILIGPSHDIPSVVVGDVTRFRQIIVNLLANGCKFTEPSGTVTVQVRSAIPPKGPGKVSIHVTVTDTGIGIRAEDVSRLFQKFSQADASHTRRYGGTGLGLAIAKTLCQHMGGSIDVCPNPAERGTQFNLVVHLDEYREEEWETPVSFALASLPDLKYNSTRIGIVDSNPNSLHGLKQLALHCSSSIEAKPFNNLQELLDARIYLHGIVINMPTVPSTKDIELLESLTAVYGSRFLVLYGFVAHKSRRPSVLTLPVSKSALTAQRPLKLGEFARFVEVICSKPPITFAVPLPGDELPMRSESECPPSVGSLSSSIAFPQQRSASVDFSTLPTPKATNGERNHSAITMPVRTVSSSSIHGVPPLRILIVEDNNVNQLVITKMLSRLGQRVSDISIANDGIEGFAMVDADPNKYEVVLMDIMMPNMDGYECTRAIRAKYGLERPWIVGLTANAFWDDRVKCHEVGMQDFVSKPASVTDLKTALLRYCEQRQPIIRH